MSLMISFGGKPVAVAYVGRMRQISLPESWCLPVDVNLSIKFIHHGFSVSRMAYGVGTPRLSYK